MKNSELVQLYVLFNKFTEEYVKEDDINSNRLFEFVDDYIDSKLQDTLVELEHTSV